MNAISTKTVTRSIALPVQKPEGQTWKEFGVVMRKVWRETAKLGNWTIMTLALNDPVQNHADGRMPAMPTKVSRNGKETPIQVYELGFKRGAKQPYPFRDYWDGCAQSAGCVIRDAEKLYKRYRKQARHDFTGQLPTVRDPAPFPVHNAQWRYWLDEADGSPMVCFPLPGGREITLRLRNGFEFTRKVEAFKKLIAGEYKPSELSVYQIVRNVSAHRGGFSVKTPHAETQHVTTMVSFSVKMPVTEKRDGRTMLVRTDPAALWVAEFPDGSPAWVYNGDDFQQLHRWVLNHNTYLQRIAQDTKFERRRDPHQRDEINGSRDRRCRKHAARVKTFIHQVTSSLSAYCCRNGVGEILYDDRVRDWLPKFSWHQLVHVLEEKLTLLGITLTGGAGEEME